MPASRFFTSHRLRLHYADWGNDAAPPLILVHGGRDHCRSWDWVAADLAAGWHVVAPDLRGHGDSAWAVGGDYGIAGYVYDLVQLVDALGGGPVTLVAHSLGGNVALRFAGLYPDRVAKIVAIEGLGPSPAMRARRDATPPGDRLRGWLDQIRGLAARTPRSYASVDAATARMIAENPRLSPVQARHLTLHGMERGEDGLYRWKFDNYIRAWSQVDIAHADEVAIWGAITAPTLLVYGADSWASNPADDGRLAAFADARVELFAGAGHWVHHDRTAEFVASVRAFLGDATSA